MEHKFADMQTTFNLFINTCFKGPIYPNGEQTKTNMGRDIMLIRRLALKIRNNERKILTQHEIIDRTAEKIALMITQVRKKSK